MPIAGLASAFLGGKSGDIMRKRLKRVADTPGLDIDAITGESLSAQQKYLPQGTELARADATAQQQLINDLLEQTLPGYGKMRDQASATASDFLAGQIPQDVTDLIQRSSAARALGGGYGGSQMQRNLFARDLGLTSLNLRDKGLSWLSALRGISPVVQPRSGLSFAPGASDYLNIRGQERTQRMGLKADAATIPGQTAAWANYMAQKEGQFNALLNTAVGAAAKGFTGGMGG